jgi:predicted nucleotidyltransferase component of viral defense system
MEVSYSHAWNSSGRFRLQVSSREKPTLPVSERPMVDQVYFRDLEFEPFGIPTLEPIEMTAEKVRAAFQRAKVRDLYDLFLLSKPDLRALNQIDDLEAQVIADAIFFPDEELVPETSFHRRVPTASTRRGAAPATRPWWRRRFGCDSDKFRARHFLTARERSLLDLERIDCPRGS